MPYRENVPTLDFTGIHLVSICGDNGNGKSAIIDAMTWALWGETRAKRDDDLIHQNANDMEVEFEFAIGNSTTASSANIPVRNGTVLPDNHR